MSDAKISETTKGSVVIKGPTRGVIKATAEANVALIKAVGGVAVLLVVAISGLVLMLNGKITEGTSVISLVVAGSGILLGGRDRPTDSDRQ